MEDVSLRVLRERALLDAPGAWKTGPVRDPAKMAESPVSGNTGNVRRPVEKSPQDVSIGSLPFDPSVISNRGRASDARSNEPEPNLESELPPPPQMEEESYAPDQSVAPEISSEQEKQEQETRLEMEAIATLPKTHKLKHDEVKFSLIKHNQVKALALELMAERFTFNGKKKFTRVSPKFCEDLEKFLYAAIAAAIKRHHSYGRVIKEF
jgi:hypothetical protein